MNNRDYWEKREEEKLNKGIKDCNKLAKELEEHYKLAYKEIEKEIKQKRYDLKEKQELFHQLEYQILYQSKK